MTLRQTDKLKLQKHDKVRVTLKDGNVLEGTFRARVADTDKYWFDPEGKAIWVTGIFEHFILIEDIEMIDVLPLIEVGNTVRYRPAFLEQQGIYDPDIYGLRGKVVRMEQWGTHAVATVEWFQDIESFWGTSQVAASALSRVKEEK